MKTHFNNPSLQLALTFGSWLLLAGRTSAQTLTNLHGFTAISTANSYINSDGASPFTGLISFSNVLFGTTLDGGSGSSGTVFAMNPDGSGFTNLHNFTPISSAWPYVNSDGAGPEARLVCSSNTLYGTTVGGGSAGNGTVFRVNSDGSGFTNLHSFTAVSANFPNTNYDGIWPKAGLVISGNRLYGTTSQGGVAGGGTVFAMNIDGSDFTNLHGFNVSAGVNDGSQPLAGLVLSGNTLYGTTSSGGGGEQEGTVFKINTDGSDFTTLKVFDTVHNNDDGSGPYAGLVLSGNALYGTTTSGGGDDIYKGGSIFKVNTNGGDFMTLHSFTGAPNYPYTNADGFAPSGQLFIANNSLYGIAVSGGRYGNGTIFQVNSDGTGFTNLYDFPELAFNTGSSDGPFPDLVMLSNTLYGTTELGGANGFGAVFSLALKSDGAPQLAIVRSGPSLILTWPATAAGYTLQTNGDLASSSWNNCGETITTNGDAASITLPPPTGNLFFRLQAQ